MVDFDNFPADYVRYWNDIVTFLGLDEKGSIDYSRNAAILGDENWLYKYDDGLNDAGESHKKLFFIFTGMSGARYVDWNYEEESIKEILRRLYIEGRVNWRYIIEDLEANQRQHAYNICLKALMNDGVLKERTTLYCYLDQTHEFDNFPNFTNKILPIPVTAGFFGFRYSGSLNLNEAKRYLKARLCVGRSVEIINRRSVKITGQRHAWLLWREMIVPKDYRHRDARIVGYTENPEVLTLWSSLNKRNKYSLAEDINRILRYRQNKKHWGVKLLVETTNEVVELDSTVDSLPVMDPSCYWCIPG